MLPLNGALPSEVALFLEGSITWALAQGLLRGLEDESSWNALRQTPEREHFPDVDSDRSLAVRKLLTELNRHFAIFKAACLFIFRLFFPPTGRLAEIISCNFKRNKIHSISSAVLSDSEILSKTFEDFLGLIRHCLTLPT